MIISARDQVIGTGHFNGDCYPADNTNTYLSHVKRIIPVALFFTERTSDLNKSTVRR